MKILESIMGLLGKYINDDRITLAISPKIKEFLVPSNVRDVLPISMV